MSDRFVQVLHALVFDAGATVLGLHPTRAALRLPNGRTVFVFRHPAPPEDLRAAANELKHTGGDLVYAGGPPSAWQTLKGALPRFTGTLRAHHVPDGEPPRSSGRSPLAAVLGGLREPTDADHARFAEAAQAGIESHAGEVYELQRFGAALNERRPVATVTLVAVVVVTFLLQRLWGAADSTAGLLRMGALQPAAVHDGDWWRLISATFLHGSVMHIGFNMMVLWSLGSFLERLFGTGRFLVLYCAAGLAGSVASLQWLEPMRFSVGASGALWGLLAAEGILGWVRSDLLPAPLVARARHAAMVNLGLNLMISFMPNIDIAAHLGGGLMGALLTFTVLTRGLAKVTDAQQPATPPSWLAAAAASALLLATGYGLALKEGQPWTLKRPATLARVDVPELGVSLERPPELAAQPPIDEPGLRAVGFGDVVRDGAFIEVARADIDPPTPEDQLLDELEGILEDNAPMKELSATGVGREEREGTRLLVGRYRDAANRVRAERVFRLALGNLWRIDVVYFRGFSRRWSGVAEKIALSIGPR